MAKGGRNNSGRVTVRHRGGGARRRIRTVDFHRLEAGPQKVERIEKDPGRSGHIALVTNEASGKKTYILAADGVRAGDTVQSYMAGVPAELMAAMGGKIDPGMLAAKTCWKGNCLPLHMVPVGSIVHAVGSKAGGPAVFCRSAGTYASIVAKDDKTKTVVLKLQSGEVRRVSRWAPATIGVVSNPTWQHRQLGKAGRSRWLNIRPTVRGVAMNAGIYLFISFPSSSLLLLSIYLSIYSLGPFPRADRKQPTIPTEAAEARAKETGTPSRRGAFRYD